MRLDFHRPSMRLPRLTFRWKMIIPAALATLVTLVVALVAGGLLARSRARLSLVEKRALPLLQAARDLDVRAASIHRQLENAIATRNVAGLGTADALLEEMHKELWAVPEIALPADRRAKLLASVDAYYDVARRATFRSIQRDESPDLPDALLGMSVRYRTLRADLLDAGARAQVEVTEGFASSRILQDRLLGWGLLFVAVASAAGIGLSFQLSRGAVRPLEQLAQAALRIAEGDLTQSVAVDGNDEVGVLGRSFQRMSDHLRAMVGTLKEASAALAQASSDLVEHTEAQTAIVQRQAAGVTETSTTTRELEQSSALAASRAASVLEVANRAGQMSEAGRVAADRSLQGLHSIQGSVEALVTQSAQLLEQARQVGDIVETVRDLAMQSHVLSLNASIEAARAGEAGLGFGVVAAEVRALAEQSGRAAEHIGRIVKDILGAIQTTLTTTEAGTRSMEGSASQIRASGESLREIGGIVGETSDAALQIAGAVQQQSQGVTQIAAAMRDLEGGMEDTVARIEALRAAASQITETAMRVSVIANGFRT